MEEETICIYCRTKLTEWSAPCSHLNAHAQCCALNAPRPTGGLKADAGKRRWDLVPLPGVAAVADVMAFGARKYAEGDWEKGIEEARLYAACQRHLYAMRSGEALDPESGLSHVAHAAANLLMWESLRNKK